MKIDETIVQAVSSEDFKPIAFRVDQKMAQVLFRDKLYTAEGKLRVIAQEYMANARDAHRAAGKSDTPIDVTLPNNMNREFIVRDYGNGIPPKIVEDVFVVYGASTKGDKPAENGGYGIGAKCAFSYVNAFSVTTTVEGVRYIYAASIDSGGMNQFTLMDTGPAVGPDGTEIRVSIRTSDVSSFRAWVKEVTHAWTPRPNFIGEAIEYRNFAPDESGERWELYHNVSPFGYRSFTSGITVTVDDIPYVLTRDQAVLCGPQAPDGAPSIENNAEKFFDLLRDKGKCLVLHFRLGELIIPPQRESVDMTHKSRSAIAAAIDRIIDHYVQRAVAAVAGATTALERVNLALSDEFYLEVTRKTSIALHTDVNLSGALVNTEDAGCRVFTARYNSRLFRDFEEEDATSLRELAMPKKDNVYVIDTKGRKLQPTELKRMMRNKSVGYGSVFAVVIHDVPVFTTAFGTDIPTLVRVGEYHHIERDVTAPLSRRAQGTHFFLKGFRVSYSGYRSAPDIESTRDKVSMLSKHQIYIDMEDKQPLYEGKVVTLDRLAELATLRTFLNDGALSSSYLHCWEDRFEENESPADFTFLEDAITEDIEELLVAKPGKLIKVAVNGAHPYRVSPDWPGIGRTDWITGVLRPLGYSEAFMDTLRTVVQLENTDHSEERENRKLAKKLWTLIDDDKRAPLDAALKAAVKELYSVRDEFIRMIYSSAVAPLFANLCAASHRVTMRSAGTDIAVDWAALLSEAVKPHTINPAYKAAP
jgi:hypothetical protein